MGLLEQASSAVSDSPKLTVSLWAQLPVAGDSYLLEWGHQPSPQYKFHTGDFDFDVYAGSWIWVDNSNPDGFLGRRLQIQLSGVWNSVFTDTSILTSTDEDLLFYTRQANKNATPYMWAEVSNIGTELAPGNWFHLLFSTDLSNPVTASGAGNPFVVCLNGTVRTLGTANHGMDSGPQAIKQSLIFTDDSFLEDADWFGIPVWPFNTVISFTDPEPHDETIIGNTPGVSIGINGMPFGIHRQSYYAGNADDTANANPTKLSDVQVWVGQYIDPAANIGKFVTIADGHGTPVLPSVAAAAFGRQTYLFKGNKAAFPLNLGNGGDFEKIGTVNDATPGPSF